MYKIKLISEESARKHKEELVNYLFLCLDENMPLVTDTIAEKYYTDMLNYLQNGSAIVVGAFHGGELVGFQWAYETSVMGERRLHSSFDCVDSNHQGKGVGSKMMRMIESIARDKGIDKIEAMCSASNENAVQYHKHNGFEIERYKLVKKL